MSGHRSVNVRVIFQSHMNEGIESRRHSISHKNANLKTADGKANTISYLYCTFGSLFSFSWPRTTFSICFLHPSNSTTTMPAASKNSQLAIQKLLTTSTCTGHYATRGDFSKRHSLPKICITQHAGSSAGRPLSLPLTDTDVARIFQHGDRAGVGLPEKTVVNLDVRKTRQLKPDKLSISNLTGL